MVFDRGIDRTETNLKVGFESHDLLGADNFVQFALDERVDLVDFIEQGCLGAPYADRCLDELQFSGRQFFRIGVPLHLGLGTPLTPGPNGEIANDRP